MAKFRFDDKSVRTAEGAPSRPVIHYDMPATTGKGEYVRGFALQITPAGTRTFLLVYVAKATGHERRLPIGAYPTLSLSAARKRAQELRAQVDTGRDPWQEQRDSRAAAQAAKGAPNDSLGDLLDAYVALLRRANAADTKNVERELRATIKEPFKSLWKKPAAQVTIDDLMKPLNALVRDGRLRQAQKVRSYLRAAYNRAAGASGDAATADLMRPFKSLPNIARDLATIKRKDRKDAEAMHAGGAEGSEESKRPLSQPELAAYWRRIRDKPGVDGALLRFHLLTGGQRCKQLSRLRLANLDAKAPAVVIYDPKGRRDEARRHLVPLIPEAVAALEAMRGDAGEFLFSIDGGRSGAGFHQVRRALAPVVAQMLEAGEVAEAFTPGEIRMTVETRLQAAGVPMETRAHLQSHGLGGVQNKHYAKHDFTTEKRDALELLRQLCEPQPDNVVTFARKGKKAAPAA
ncbi:integrase family protein [Pseudoxanthomonas sp. Soil82]|uniref:integrase family protein n=1 Tax=Pseudoxanthomonas sp. Soil82 TaxID=3157341 RepID=UPI00339068F4